MGRPILMLLMLLTAVISGCQTAPEHPVLPPLKIQTATLEELTAKINRQSEAIRSVKTTLDIRVRDRSMEGSRECQGLLAHEKPDKLYLKGYRPLIPTFFTIVARENTFWVHIPKENRVLTGKVSDLNGSEGLSMGIRPDDLMRALNIQPVPPSETHIVEMQESPLQYILFVFRKMGDEKILERQIFVERYFLNVEREVFYNAYGVAELDIARKDYTPDEATPFPQEIIIFRPDRGSTLFLRANKLRVNPVLRNDLFDFQMPGGATIEELKND